MAELLNAANRARTALSGAITATATSFSVEDASFFPKPPFAITVEDEIMEVGTVSGNTFSNVTRGLEGTIAVAHEQGAPVENRFTAGTYNRMVDSFNEQKVKVIKVEQELNNFKTTLQQININQEAKQKVSGYDIITIPKNAANGQVSVAVKGMTLKNELNYTPETWEEWSGDGIIDKDSSGLTIGGASKFAYVVLSAKTSTKYGVLLNIVSNDLESNLMALTSIMPSTVVVGPGELGNKKIVFMSKAEFTATRFGFYTQPGEIGSIKLRDIRMFELPTGSEIENDFNTMTADQLAQKYPYINGDSVKSTVGAMRLKSVSADETEVSTAYVVAKDEQGKIAELRSLPNGVKDEIKVSEGKLIKRVSDEYIVKESDVLDVTDLENVAYAKVQIPLDSILANFSYVLEGKPFKPHSDSIDMLGFSCINNISKRQLRVYFAKGTTLGQAQEQLSGLTLIYQLATPIEIPIQTSGSLVSYPSGTVYIEPFVADAGIYTDKTEVLYSDLPIKALEKISKVDFDTGLETELDITAAVIAEDKLSFTHPDLTSGDIVFFVYKYDRESTEGEAEVEFYDSRYVIKGEDDKFYQWEIEAKLVEGVITPSIKLVEV